MNIPKLNYSDMPETGWWSFLPKKVVKWIRLGRFDRPVGFWLLLLPGWWTLPLSNISLKECIKLMIIFFIGSVMMRAAGCTINDLWDKDIDRKINRTKDRPIASGEITTSGAIIFLLLILLISFFCLVQLNTNTWLIALASIPLIIIYPLAKKFTKWPQIFLGLTFSWAVPTAWSAADQSWNLGIFTMYFATVFWIIGYDTVYGCQDRKEDEIIGVKNSAISAQKFLTLFVGTMYFFTFTLLIFSGWKLNANLIWFLGVFITGIHFIFQINKIKNLEMYNPLIIFKSNVFVGLILTVSSLGNYLDFK